MEKKRFTHLNRILPVFLSVIIATGLLAVAIVPGHAYAPPTTSIVSVSKDVSVTISGWNFPVGRIYTVRMGAYGSYGIGGTVVGSYDSSAGSSFTQTYTIPSGLAGSYRIAIRFDSPDGYYSFDWFVNDASASTTSTAIPFGPSGYSGYPTFDIASVSSGTSVTILTHNMPAGQTFTVRMGDYGTLGVGGTVVGTTSDSGGSFSATFTIPDWLASKGKIAIRMDGPTGLYAFNWFYNNSTVAVTPVPYATPVPGPTPVPGYYGFPSFYITAVVKDSKVTIYASNFPAGQTFNVRMGAYGTLGIGGILVTTQDSGSGGSFSATYDIPAALAGSSKIAIRLETSNGWYYAFNWFYNNTTY